VRVNREIATFRKMGPTKGIASLKQSKARRPIRSAGEQKHDARAAAAIAPNRMLCLTRSLIRMTNMVKRHLPASEQTSEHISESRHDKGHHEGEDACGDA